MTWRLPDILSAFFLLLGFSVPLGLAAWLSATARDRSEWIAYGGSTVLFLAPTVAYFFLRGDVIDLTTPVRTFLPLFGVLLGFFWLVGSGIGFLFRSVRGVMQRAK